MARIPIGLQLYTVRNETAKDFVGTMKEVAKVGYAGVEFAGYGGLSAKEIKALLSDLNLQPAGTHVGLEPLENDIAPIIDFSKEIGNRYLIVAGLAGHRYASKDAWLATADSMNRAGAILKDNDLQLSYHNHAFEFSMVDGQPGYDLFFSAMDPNLVKVELDTYWVKVAGCDPVEYLRKYSSRLSHTHLKEFAGGSTARDTEIGSGDLDWEAIFAVCENSTVTWHVVEQEDFDRPPLESIRISFDWLKSKGYVA